MQKNYKVIEYLFTRSYILKKISQLGMLLLAIGTLTGCQQNKTTHSSTAKANEEKMTQQTNTTTSEKPVENSSSVDENYKEVYVVTLQKVADDTSYGHATVYVFQDIDNNGFPELLTGSQGSDGYYPLAIYYNNNGESTYLARTYAASSGGYREGFSIYNDGSILTSSWAAYSSMGEGILYRLNEDNSGVTKLVQADYQVVGAESGSANSADTVFGLVGKQRLDYSSLDWQPLDSYKTSSNSQ